MKDGIILFLKENIIGRNLFTEDVVYKLEISMVSDAMQPDDILHNYTGILK